jgi:hypothetical protein
MWNMRESSSRPLFITIVEYLTSLCFFFATLLQAVRHDTCVSIFALHEHDQFDGVLVVHKNGTVSLFSDSFKAIASSVQSLKG